MPNILVAEDEPDISNLIALTLKFGGLEVISTSNGVDAVSHAQEDDPDLIILDVRMPRMSGYEACRRLKADESTAGIPIVFLSARGQENEVKAGLAAGGVDYILKPFAPDELIERVKELLNTHAPEAVASPAGERSGARPANRAEKSGKEPAAPSPAAPLNGPVAGSPTVKKPGEKANGTAQRKRTEAKPEQAKGGKAEG
jgi:two-component system alkaline phosphatase synthesis response regulator PhoP